MAETQQQPRAEKPLHELLSHALVDIYVGPNSTHWILHEKLLCARSKFFQKIFYAKDQNNSSFGLPDDEDEPFNAFVAWLYASTLKPPQQEADLTNLFELYLMGEKWQVPALTRDVLKEVREWYAKTDTYPGLRRVQYIYANTDEESEMRKLLVKSVARMMALSESIPQHWDKALRKNGQLAVDLIKSIQEWRIDEGSVPDARKSPEDANVKEERKDEVKGVEKQAERGQEQSGKKEEKEEPKTNGVNGTQDEDANDVKKEPEEKQKLTNGVNGHHEDDE